MRLTDYDFVFEGWKPEGDTVYWASFDLIVHNGLPYVLFYAQARQSYVSVRCDPCSLDQDRAAYATMVRADLEKAIRKLAEPTIQP